MNLGSSARTVVIGALAAGALGCTAGTLLRPELGPARTGPALIVSEAPALPDAISYEDRWWSAQGAAGTY